LPDVLIEMKNISKCYNSNQVLKDANLTIYKGMIHALVGANGSGKTTLMKILAGLVEKDEGSIYIDGKMVHCLDALEAQKQGIEMVFHESSLFQESNIYENMFINREPLITFGPFTFINWNEIYKETKNIVKEYELGIDPSQKVKKLSIAKQRFIEAIRGIIHNAKVIIIDEPTVEMDKYEVDLFNRLILKMKQKGIAVIYISHHIEEIINMADYIYVLRDGQIVSTLKHDGVTAQTVIKMLVGNSARNKFPKLVAPIGEEILSVRNLKNNNIKDLSFSLRKGEIIGLAGLRGSGRTSLAKILFGVESYQGEIRINHQKKSIHSTESAVKNGICYIGSGGIDEGIFQEIAISDNITSVNTFYGKRKLTRSFKRYIAAYYINLLNIRTSSVEEIVKNLSAGNKKKVLLAKWLFSNSNIFIFNQLTANIDAVSKIDIYNIFNELLRKGKSIIMISNDFSEMIGLCDRILVIAGGKITKEFKQNEATEELILYYASNKE
jgi:ribose transport system ATP-binding protein